MEKANYKRNISKATFRRDNWFLFVGNNNRKFVAGYNYQLLINMSSSLISTGYQIQNILLIKSTLVTAS